MTTQRQQLTTTLDWQLDAPAWLLPDCETTAWAYCRELGKTVLIDWRDPRNRRELRLTALAVALLSAAISATEVVAPTRQPPGEAVRPRPPVTRSKWRGAVSVCSDLDVQGTHRAPKSLPVWRVAAPKLRRVCYDQVRGRVTRRPPAIAGDRRIRCG